MGYNIKYKAPTIKKEFPEIGDNEGTPFFVEFKNPHLLPYGEKVKTQTAAGITSGATPDERINQMGSYAQSLITSWNLLDKETEEPINFNDSNALQKVPSEIVETIISEMLPSKAKQEEIKNS
jgi:hypothetical protein